MHTTQENPIAGHLLALFSVIVWGWTFISTRILLDGLDPYQILLYRCLIAWLVLSLLRFPHARSALNLRHEGLYFLASLCGVSLYFVCENIALTKTYASNAALIVTVSPLLSVLFNALIFRQQRLSLVTLSGLVLSFAGVALVITNGALNIHLSPAGDALALLAALSWAFFPLVLKRIDDGAHPVVKTRKIFRYSILTVALFMWSRDMPLLNPHVFAAVNLCNLLFLGVIASALCYLSWDRAVVYLGVRKTMAYMYLVPFVTVLSGHVLLRETITPLMLGGGLLILSGLYLNNRQQAGESSAG
ncbi:DMT family transporter [Musicola keenii]|uniref:DMT family transporter n=1 Tax=Musicola keenii TaxID=2884250 RepID=UPI001782466C|nr:DMT family transporter [Musicola keenii]